MTDQYEDCKQNYASESSIPNPIVFNKLKRIDTSSSLWLLKGFRE